MTAWLQVDDAQAREHWDGWLAHFEDAYVYQSTGWAEYKRHAGWAVLRQVIPGNCGTPRAMAQAFVKRVPVLGPMLWIPGGPLWRGARQADDELALAAHLQHVVRPWFVRQFQMSRSGTACEAPWWRPTVPNGSGISVLVDVTAPLEEWIKQIASKHRYTVRRAQREPIEWRTGNNSQQLAALAQLANELSDLKRGTGQTSSSGELQALCAALGPNVITLTGFLGGKPVAGCQVLRWGRRAIYATAATNQAGRDVSAAYAMIAQLREVLRGAGVVEFDFGGIDPDRPAARGVDHFKLGFGGRTFAYDGEWDWGSSQVARRLGNFAIALRRRRGAL